MSLQEKLQISGNVTFVGVTIVFLVLLLLIVVIGISARIIRGFVKPPESGANEGPDQEYLVSEEDETWEGNNAVLIEQDGEEDPAIIAVIMAAITACMGTASGFRLNAIRRIENKVPAWNRSGRNEYLATRL